MEIAAVLMAVKYYILPIKGVLVGDFNSALHDT